jgi:hypothetical protein
LFLENVSRSTLGAPERVDGSRKERVAAAEAVVQSSTKMETYSSSQVEQGDKLARGMLGAKLQARLPRHTVVTEAVQLAKMAALHRATAALLAVAERRTLQPGVVVPPTEGMMSGSLEGRLQELSAAMAGTAVVKTEIRHVLLVVAGVGDQAAVVEMFQATVVAEAEAEGTMAEEVEVARVMGQGVAAAVDILPVFVALQQFQALQANTPACSAGVVYLRLKMDGL